MTYIDQRYNRPIIERAGFQVGSSAENRFAVCLIHKGWTPDEVRQQHRLGPYRLDFALLGMRLDIEIDGPHHESRAGRQRDAVRDQFVAAEMWRTIRIPYDDEDLMAQWATTLHALRHRDHTVWSQLGVAGTWHKEAPRQYRWVADPDGPIHQSQLA